jgi:hypothetical protein
MNINYYLEAVSAYQQANKSLKHFAECCYHVSDRETKALAQDCKCSVDTIENYRNAYTLFIELGGETSEPVRKLWERTNIALWVKAAQLRIRLSLSLPTTQDYLETASRNNMTRESFAAHVDEKENNTPKWIRRLQSVISRLAPIKQDYRSEIPAELQTEFDAALDEFIRRLQKLLEAKSEKQGGD